MVGLGITAGGDKLATAYYTNGDSTDLRAGGGALLLAGLEYRVMPELSVQGTIGYHIDAADARNGHADFSRVPVELMAYYHINQTWRVGGGARYVSNAKLHGSGFASNLDQGFQDTTGAVAEVEYFTSPRVGIKLRYVKEDYKPTGYDNYKVSGDHIGLIANMYF